MLALAVLLSRCCERSPRARELLANLVENDPGTADLISDYYTPTLILCLLALSRLDRSDLISLTLRRLAIWLCDRYEKGIGLASVDAEEDYELRMLFGYCLEDRDVHPTRSSLLASYALELASFLGQREVYGPIRNDLDAVGIVRNHFLIEDTIGSCLIDHGDVVFVPSMNYPDWMVPWNMMVRVTQVIDHSMTFAFAEAFGFEATLLMTLLLRDRVYKHYWSSRANLDPIEGVTGIFAV